MRSTADPLAETAMAVLQGGELKVLHVDPETSFGGGERQVAGLIRHLAHRGHENVLAASPGAPLAAIVPAADARRRPLAIRNDVDLVAAWRLRRLVAQESPHIVHFHTSRALAMSPWLRGYADRCVVTRRMDYSLRRGWWTDRLYNRSVAAAVAISEEVRRKLLAAGVRAERLHVIHSGVEPAAGLPGASGRAAARARFAVGDELALGIVAALETRKGHDVLWHAIARLRGDGVRLRCLVCGDGSQRSALEALARHLGIIDVVGLLGEQRQVADVLAALDVFVLPSRYEGLGVAILEAMAMALPVVATAVGGIPETVADGRTGLLVPPEDPAALAAAIAALDRDRALAQRMGEAGRRRVIAEFSMEAMASRYERLYEAVSRQRASPARDGDRERARQ
jgi:glycosyltransferase involved in cell wall biosynthesis